MEPRSPFPGMDPYLEPHWRDVHHALITYSRDQLQELLPADLLARVEERVFVEADEAPARAIHPDVHVVEHSSVPSAAKAGGTTGVVEPLVVHVADEPVTQGFLEIVDAATGSHVVTVIEFLSPSNKLPGEGRELYLQKQRELKSSATSLVEIDLTRSGERLLALPTRRIPRSHRTTYQVCVRRAWKPRDYEIYRAPLRERLAPIRIPLRESDQDAILDLQAAVDQCYRNGRYQRLNYRSDPVPPLDPDDATWADELLRTRGLR